MKTKHTASVRWLYLAVGTFTMLFAGILYAWSILKTPLAAEFGWNTSELALNFTLTMCFFCLGGFFGSQISRKIGAPLTIIIAGVLAGAGFILTGLLTGSVYLLYATYAILAGLGIGVAYNVIISTVNAWFPDKRGLSSGCLLMGFGASSLLFGTVLDKLFTAEGFGWRKTYVLFGIAVAACLLIAGLIIRRPGTEVQLPAPKKSAAVRQENFEVKDFTTSQMLRRFSFWMAFVSIGLLAAVGSSVISFAKDLALCIQTNMGTRQKGKAESRKGSGDWDYYSVIFGAVEVGTTALILEHSFYTNTKAAKWLMDDNNLRKMAQEEAKIVAKWFDVAKTEDKPEESPKRTISASFPVIYPGDKNEYVVVMQALLIGYGYKMENGGKVYGVDGSAGPATQKALKQYQSDSELDPDGKCGPATWASLLRQK